MRALKASTAAAVALFCAFGSAGAEQEFDAQLTEIHGDVRIDSGNGFVLVSGEATGLKLGDRVMVAKDGGAILTLGPSCSVPLEAPSMTTVAEAACVVGTQDGTGGGGGGGGGGLALMAAGPLATTVGPSAASSDDEQDSVSP